MLIDISQKMRAERDGVTYTFERIFVRNADGEPLHQAELFEMQVRDFSFGSHIRHFTEVFENEYSGLATVQTTFQVSLSQEFVLEKMAALFAFAASVKFRLCNQTFSPK